MRLLHTSDWHVGKSLRGRSRLDEFEAALSEVVDIAAEEGVDAVLVAGDMYDQRAPAPEADALVFDALVRLHEAGIPVIGIPGNHDSAVRLEVLSKLLSMVGVTLVPKVVPPEGGGVVEVSSAPDQPSAWMSSRTSSNAAMRSSGMSSTPCSRR